MWLTTVAELADILDKEGYENFLPVQGHAKALQQVIIAFYVDLEELINEKRTEPDFNPDTITYGDEIVKLLAQVVHSPAFEYWAKDE